MVQKENIPLLWEEEFSNVWMVEVETVAFMIEAWDTYHVFTNILDNMMDTVDAHDVVRNILFDIINTITTLS